MSLVFLKGDATAPQAKGKKIIAHICNDLGGWGKGFVLAISKRWKEPEAGYRKWHKERDGFELGAVKFVEVEPTIWVANMIGQHGMKSGSKGPPIRYEAVESCLQMVAEKANELGATVHMPRIGCGLAGGKWEKIEPIIKRTLVDGGIDVYVYDFE
jgi:O-acetyl-ADP-ribose deacetylase (regulator of RNase III)